MNGSVSQSVMNEWMNELSQNWYGRGEIGNFFNVHTQSCRQAQIVNVQIKDIFLVLSVCQQYICLFSVSLSNHLVSQTCSKDHLLIKTAFYGSQGFTFHFIGPAYKDHLCLRTIVCWSLCWSLYRSFTVPCKHDQIKCYATSRVQEATI